MPDWLPVVAYQASRRCLPSRSPAPNRLLPQSVDGYRGKQKEDSSFSTPLGDHDLGILRKRIDTLAKQIDRRDREAASDSSSAKQGGKGPLRKRSDKLLSVADIQGPLVEKDNLPG